MSNSLRYPVLLVHGMGFRVVSLTTMKHPFSDILMWVPSLAVWLVEGENDGLLPPTATKWGNWQGVCRGITGRGISHCDE